VVEISLLGSGRARVGNHPGYSTAYATRSAAPGNTGASISVALRRVGLYGGVAGGTALEAPASQL